MKTMKVVFLAFLIIVFKPAPPLNIVHSHQNTVIQRLQNRKNKSLNDFLHMMGKVESNNNHRIVNRFGMMGKYQISPVTMRTLGFKYSKTEFLNNPELQDEVMMATLRYNRNILRNTIKRYSGRTINGVHITESGILAGAHLVGAGGVLTFFHPEKYNHRTVDGNGTSVVYYIKKFANYQLNL